MNNYANIDACWEALDNAVKRLDEGKTTMDEIIKTFELETDIYDVHEDGSITFAMEPRWGWVIEWHESVGYYLCY